MIPLELPGHGKRIQEPLLTGIHAMTSDIFEQIRPKSFNRAQDRLHTPYAIYGHSLGALLAYLLTLRIVQEEFPPPLHLFVSGHQGPSIPEQVRDLHLLPRNEFLRRIRKYGGISPELAEKKELMDLFIPIMKTDFEAISTYKYTPAFRLNLPITVMFGSDEEISREDALAWQEVTTRKIQVQEFSGKHFFIFEHSKTIARLIMHTLFQNFT